jgi:hypothetical protein
LKEKRERMFAGFESASIFALAK